MSVAQGRAMMLIFALATTPSLFLISGFSTQIGRFINHHWVRQAVAILVIILGVQLLLAPLLMTHH